MKPVLTHPWNLSQEEALALQQNLASKVIMEDECKDIRLVAGVDVAYDEKNDTLFAAVVVMDLNTLDLIETVIAQDEVHFPYIPGLFSFRELPSIAKALGQLNTTPDVIVCDGQGFAHPRRFGLACHLGVLFNIPTVGCGKTRLLGEAAEPGIKRGDYTPLIDHDQVIGYLLRTQDHTKPVYISIGHLISLPTARELILKLCPAYRLPQTTRLADQAVRKALAEFHFRSL